VLITPSPIVVFKKIISLGRERTSADEETVKYYLDGFDSRTGK
jgi:hypothetical protein